MGIGNMDSPTKGFDLLIEALPQLAEAISEVTLTLVGDGRLRGDLERLAEAQGIADRVHFTGFVGDKVEIGAILDMHDLFVMPSRSEGLPRAAVEAQARGLPCVASDAGGTPEVVPGMGVHGVDDLDDLVRLIVRVHQDGNFASALAREGHALATDVARSAEPQFFTAVVRDVLVQHVDR